jgi:hypothetical protein
MPGRVTWADDNHLEQFIEPEPHDDGIFSDASSTTSSGTDSVMDMEIFHDAHQLVPDENWYVTAWHF